MQELIEGLDIHSRNQKEFNLPEGDKGRLIAKILVFRIFYGGSAYSFCHDSDFMPVSTSEKYWQSAIDKFYNKYKGIYHWHERIIKEVGKNGYLMSPSGRRYNFSLVKGYRGELVLPETTIKNYLVQGLGADVMSIARVSFKRRWNDANIDGVLINTVHDSIVCDVPSSQLKAVTVLFHDVFATLPANFKRVFGVEFNLPLRAEVKYGPNMMEMEEYKVAA